MLERDLDEMAQALRSAIDGGNRITGLRALTAGHSNETYVLEGLDRILRVQPPGPALMAGYDLAHQHAIYRAVKARPEGPLVPEVYDLCLDPSVIGSPFFVMELCRGESTEWRPPAWLTEGGPDLQDDVCRQWIGAVSAIHTMPAETYGDAPETSAQAAERWLALATQADAPRRLLSLLSDIAEDPPPPSGPPACVHGDAKFANFLWDRGRLVAVLDWEMARVGEPLTDIGYIVSMIPTRPGEKGSPAITYLPGWWTREQIIAEWERATGRSAEHVGRHEILAMGLIGALFARGIQLYRDGHSDDPRFARWQSTLPHFLDEMERRARRAGLVTRTA
jgi:aminoglycoside phosphotransferase (APT) family kinase protein